MCTKILSSLAFVVVLCGCAEEANKRESVGSTIICSPIDYSNGVMYFPCTEAKFGNSLSAWRLLHPEAEIIGLTSDNTGMYGNTSGYFLVVKTTK